MRALLLFIAAAMLLPGAGATGTRLSTGNQFSPYTLQLADVGPSYYKQMAARPMSNRDTVRDGTPLTIIRRFGRIGGFERVFVAKQVLKEDLFSVGAGVMGTRTSAGAHGYFLWATKPSRIRHKLSQTAKGATLHVVKIPRIGAESRCYGFKDTIKGTALVNYVCYWRQNQLLGSLLATAFWARRLEVPLTIPFAQLVAMQQKRMTSFSH
jgi:hypothetical protein